MRGLSGRKSLCEVCLGENPYIRMEKLAFGAKVCHVTKLPYQGYRWRPLKGRFKETVICGDVARERNICQCCLNDMKYGLPVGVRDALLKTTDNNNDQQNLAPVLSNVGLMYRSVSQQQQQLTQDYNSSLSFSEHMQNVVPNAQLEAFARSRQLPQPTTSQPAQPTGGRGGSHNVAFRNLPKLCTFWLGGLCRRTSTGRCPYRPCCGTYVFPEIARDKDMHERLVAALNTTGPVTLQLKLDKDIRDALKEALRGNKAEAIKKRVRGEDDHSKAVLHKLTGQLDSNNNNSTLDAPSDMSVRTLWVGRVPEDVTEQDLFQAFYVFGGVLSVHVVRASRCAFVQFALREQAEAAATQLYRQLVVRGHALALNWALPSHATTTSTATSSVSVSVPGAESMCAPPGLEEAPVSSYSIQFSSGSHAEEEEERESASFVRSVRQRQHQQQSLGDGGTLTEAGSAIQYPSMDPSRLGSTS